MILRLETCFSEEENHIINSFTQHNGIELFVARSIDTGKLKGVSNPNRIIAVGGLYLCEEKDELSSWYMGQKHNDQYSFWGNYGGLQEALEGL